MATVDEYAKWIVDNADKQGTEEFNIVARAYEEAKRDESSAQNKEFGAEEAFQMTAPAVMGSGPTGMRQLTKEVGGAVAPYAKGAVAPVSAAYRAHPILAPAADVLGLATMGIPPVAASQGAMGVADRVNQARGAAQGVSRVMSQSGMIESPVTGRPYPESVPAFREMQRAAPDIGAKLSEIYQKGGGNNAVKAWLQSAEAAPYMNDPRFAAAAESYIGKVPGMGTQVMRAVAPVARAAARVAGPVAIGMDVYDAAKYAQESQLGPRLAQGQGRSAQQAFRNMPINQQYGGLTPQEQAILEQDRIDQAIRRKAASKVLGPIAPGQ